MILRALIFCVSFSALAFVLPSDTVLFREDFERGITFTDAPVSPGDTMIALTVNPALQEWPDSGGVGVIDYDRPELHDDFSYAHRVGNRLSGVKGLLRRHTEGADIRTPMPGASPGDAGYGMPFEKGRAALSRTLPPLYRVYGRFSMRVDSLVSENASPLTRLRIHALLPMYQSGILLKPLGQDSVRLEFSLNWIGTVCSTNVPLRRALWIEYEYVVDTLASTVSFACWVDGRALPARTLQRAQGLRDSAITGLEFAYGTDAYPVHGRVIVDDILFANHRVGLPAQDGAFRVGVDSALGRLIAIPENDREMEGFEVQVSPTSDWRFPGMARREFPLLRTSLYARHNPYDFSSAPFRSRIKRKNSDWSPWCYSTASVLPLPADAGQPMLDSVQILKKGTRAAADTLVKGCWYDLACYGTDPKGFNNLSYNYIVLSNSTHPGSNLLSLGDVYDPKGSYFLSCSRSEAGQKKLLYIHAQPGSDAITELFNACSLYADARPEGFIIDSARKCWETRIRIPSTAEPGTWMAQVCLFNMQEAASPAWRKKVMVVEASESRIPLPAIAVIFAVIATAVAFWFLRRKRNVTVLPPSKYHFKVKQAHDYINAHFTEELTIQQIAGEVNANPGWLGTQFKKEAGTDIRNYINHLRCKKASELLMENKLNISQIGYKVGFNNPDYFNQVFKKALGKSPSQFQKDYFSSKPE